MMKGLYQGFKYTLSHMFVVKEREIEISHPTDVKHVAHIGWDGPSGTGGPSWMNEFKTGPDFAATSIASTFSPWSSQDYSGSLQQQSESDMSKDALSMELGAMKKKDRRKKSKSTSSPTRSDSTSSRRSSRGAKMKSKCIENESKQVELHRQRE